MSPTTVQKWRKRTTTADAPMGPKEVRSTVLTPEEEAIVVAFRRHTLLPLDECLYGLQPSIPPRAPKSSAAARRLASLVRYVPLLRALGNLHGGAPGVAQHEVPCSRR